eukprot:3470120-Alexandrium_andersonii.AAC.1
MCYARAPAPDPGHCTSATAHATTSARACRRNLGAPADCRAVEVARTGHDGRAGRGRGGTGRGAYRDMLGVGDARAYGPQGRPRRRPAPTVDHACDAVPPAVGQVACDGGGCDGGASEEELTHVTTGQAGAGSPAGLRDAPAGKLAVVTGNTAHQAQRPCCARR